MQDPVSARQRVRYTPPSRTYMPQPPDAGEEVGPYRPLRSDMEQLLGLPSSPVPANPVPRGPTRAEAWPQRAYRPGGWLLRSHQPLGTTPGDMSYFSDPRYGWDNQMGSWRMKHPPSKAARVPFSPLHMPGDRTFAEGLRALDDGSRVSVTFEPDAIDPVTQKIRHRDKTIADFRRWYSTLPDHVKRQNANTGPPPFDFDAVMVHQQHRDEVRERMRKAAPGSEDAKNLANFLRQDEYSVEPAMGSTIPSLMAVGSGVGPAAMMGLQGSPVTSGTRSRTPSSAVVRDKSAIPAAEEARYLANDGLQYGGRSPAGAIAGAYLGLGPAANVLAGSPFTMLQDFGPELNAETLRRELRQQNLGIAGDDVEGGIYRKTMGSYLQRLLAGTRDPAVRQQINTALTAVRNEQDATYGPPTESRKSQLDRAMTDTAQYTDGLLSRIDTERPLQNQRAADMRASMMGLPEHERSYFAQEHPDFSRITPEDRKTIMMDAQRRGTHGDAILNRQPVPSPTDIAAYRSRNPNADMNPVRNRAHLSGGALSPDSPYVTGGQSTPAGLLPGSVDATPSGWYERYQRDQALAQLDANDKRLQAPGGHDEFYLNRTRAMLSGSETETDAYKGTLRYADDPMQSRRKTYGMQSERFVGPGNSAGTYGTNRLGALRVLKQTGQLSDPKLLAELRTLEGDAEASAQAKRDSLPARKAAAAERAAAKKNKTLERRNRAAVVRAVNAGVLPATALAANPIGSANGSVPAVLATSAPNTAKNQQDRATIRSNLVTGVRADGSPMSPFLNSVAQSQGVNQDNPTSVLIGSHAHMLQSGTELSDDDVMDLWTYLRSSTDDSYWAEKPYRADSFSYEGGPGFFQIMQDLRQLDNPSAQQKQSFAKRINELRGKSLRNIEAAKNRYQEVPMFPLFN